MTTLVAVVAALVVYRLTMLVTADEITEPIRDRIFDRYRHPVHEAIVRPERSKPDMYGPAYSGLCRCGAQFVGTEWGDVASDLNAHVNEHNRSGTEITKGPRWLVLLSCPWCSSWWIALPVVWSAWCFGDRAWWMIPAGSFAASAVTGIIATYAKPES